MKLSVLLDGLDVCDKEGVGRLLSLYWGFESYRWVT